MIMITTPCRLEKVSSRCAMGAYIILHVCVYRLASEKHAALSEQVKMFLFNDAHRNFL